MKCGGAPRLFCEAAQIGMPRCRARHRRERIAVWLRPAVAAEQEWGGVELESPPAVPRTKLEVPILRLRSAPGVEDLQPVAPLPVRASGLPVQAMAYGRPRSEGAPNALSPARGRTALVVAAWVEEISGLALPEFVAGKRHLSGELPGPAERLVLQRALESSAAGKGHAANPIPALQDPGFYPFVLRSAHPDCHAVFPFEPGQQLP